MRNNLVVLLFVTLVVVIALAGCERPPEHNPDNMQTDVVFYGYDHDAATELRGTKIQLDRLNTNIEKYLEGLDAK
jgi:hypothetical protein